MYFKEENYCSFSPEELFGVKFNYACYLHDRQYRNEVKKQKTRLQADKDLRNKIYSYFVDADKLFLGKIISNIYYLAVRLFGKKSWQPQSI